MESSSREDESPSGSSDQARRDAAGTVFNQQLLAAPALPLGLDVARASLMLRAQQGLLGYPTAFQPGLALNPFYALQQQHQQLAAAQAAAAAFNPFGRMLAFPQPGAALLGLPGLAGHRGPLLFQHGLVGAAPAAAVAAPSPTPSPAVAAAIWAEGRTDEGRVFYHNKVTGQSVWTKPDELKTPAEKACSSSTDSWREYVADDGRKYYHNATTKETRWTLPWTEGADGSSSAAKQEEAAGGSGGSGAGEQQTEMERAMAATLAALSRDEQSAPQGPAVDPEVELRKRQADRFTDLLRDKYSEGLITATCKWDAAVPHIQADPRFRILSKVSEKKQLFNAWKVARQREERDEKRAAIKRAKQALEAWLLEHPRMKSVGFQYRRADELFAEEPQWSAVADDDRREIFREAHAAVTKREEDERAEVARRNVQALNDILIAMPEVTYRTTWAQAQRLLIGNALFAEDDTLQSMDKMDALIVFEGHIRHLEKLHEEEREEEEKRQRREERKSREAFKALLEELHEKGEVTSVSLWSSLYTTISSDARFDSILHQGGSTPLDLFKFYVEDLKEQYGADRAVIKEVLAARGAEIRSSTTLDEVIGWVQEDERGRKVDLGNLKLCYNSFVEKAEEKEREQEREEGRRKRRLESEFRNLLRTLQPPIERETEWAAVRSKVEKEPAFLAIDSEEEREAMFVDFARGMSGESTGEAKEGRKEKKRKEQEEKKEEEERKEGEDSSSEDESKKKRRRNDSSGDEMRRKNRRRHRSRSHSD